MEPQNDGSKKGLEDFMRDLNNVLREAQSLINSPTLTLCVLGSKRALSEEDVLAVNKKVQDILNLPHELALRPSLSRQKKIVRLRFALRKKIDEVWKFGSKSIPMDLGDDLRLRVALWENDRSKREPTRCFIKFRIDWTEPGNHDDVARKIFDLAGKVLFVDHRDDVYTVAYEDKRVPRDLVGLRTWADLNPDNFEILWNVDHKCSFCTCLGHTQSRCPFSAESPPSTQEMRRIKLFNTFFEERARKRSSARQTSGKSSAGFPDSKSSVDGSGGKSSASSQSSSNNASSTSLPVQQPLRSTPQARDSRSGSSNSSGKQEMSQTRPSPSNAKNSTASSLVGSRQAPKLVVKKPAMRLDEDDLTASPVIDNDEREEPEADPQDEDQLLAALRADEEKKSSSQPLTTRQKNLKQSTLSFSSTVSPAHDNSRNSPSTAATTTTPGQKKRGRPPKQNPSPNPSPSAASPPYKVQRTDQDSAVTSDSGSQK